MANTQAIQEAILRAVDTIVTQRTNELELDKTITAIIKKNVGQKNGKMIYEVSYSGGLFNAICQNVNDIYLPNTAVYVLIPQGKFSNEKIIIDYVDSVINDKELSLNSIDASYAKLNTNLLSFKNENITYGLHSWHENNNYDSNIDHQYQYIYQNNNNNSNNDIIFNQDILDICKENAIALMVKADFQTNLSIEQRNQLNAKYGLIFNFAFHNLNNNYGETNEEIFNNLAPIIETTIWDKENKVYKTQNISYYNNQIIDMLNNDIFIKKQIIDNYISEINELYANFMIKKSELNTQLINDIINSYLQNLNQLAKLNNTLSQKEQYNNWKNIKIGESNYKYEQFILDSDNMIGNPFVFNQWNTQYSIFQIDQKLLSHLDSIIFFQQGFNQDYNTEQLWPLSDPGKPDILVRNIQIQLLKLSTKENNYTLKVEPINNSDFVITKNSDTIQFKASFLRNSYEDLTLNNNTKIYWFKESSSITNSNKINYNALGGLGWEEILDMRMNEIFSISSIKNQGFKNNYKCVINYNDSIFLEYIFSIYNKITSSFIKLESNLGTEFSFDAGIPTISIKIKDLETQDSDFLEKGCLIDENGVKVFLNKNIENSDNFFTNLTYKTVWNDIEEKILLSDGQLIDSFDSEYTTRINCPISKINNNFTVICYVQKKNNVTNEYYDIGSAQLNFKNTKSNINVADYRIQILNSDQVFKYDLYGKAPTDESNKNPITILPLQVKLLTLADVEINSSNYEVEWIFPEEKNTLLISPNTESLIIKSKGCSFDIKKEYDSNCCDNQIVCHIVFNNKHFYKNTKFYFGKEGNNGTNGTDIIAKIEYAKDDDYTNILNKEPVTLYTYKNETNKWKSFINTDLMRNLKSTQIIFKSNSINEDFDSIFKVSLYQKSEKLNYNISPIYSLAGNHQDGKYFDIGANLIWNGDKIEERKPLIQNIKAEIKLNDNETYYAFVSIPIIEYNTNPIDERNLISINKQFYLNDVTYNADGRNPIYNHNQGLKLNLPDNITMVEYTAKGGFEKHWINSEEYIYLEGTPSFSLLSTKESQNKSFNITKIGNDKDIIYIIPNDTYNGSVTNNRIEAKCYDENTLIATVYAPIYMSLNTFGLTSLNAWDGNSVTIDNDGGYVMAPQVGAGEKDSNNRFTGILMGKTETYTGKAEKEKQVGLFGYSYGLQSIFLDAETGNATFGLPEGYTIETRNGISIPVQKEDEYGEGRIEFRPGGESKIGGWKIGRRSLYYTMKPSPIFDMKTNDKISDYEIENNHYKYIYSGEIGSKYFQDEETPQQRQYAAHHKKDIEVHDSGILLSSDPPYISVVGTMLTEQEIENNSTGYLEKGDSIEIQLDPQTPTVFTVFRHNSEFRKQKSINNGRILGDRTFLAGINARGQLQANIIGSSDDNNNQASMYFELTNRFNQSEGNQYIGAIFEAGDNTNTYPFLKLLVNKNDFIDNKIDNIYLSVPGELNIDFKPTIFTTSNSLVEVEYNNGYCSIEASSLREAIEGCLKAAENVQAFVKNGTLHFGIEIGE